MTSLSRASIHLQKKLYVRRNRSLGRDVARPPVSHWHARGLRRSGPGKALLWCPRDPRGPGGVWSGQASGLVSPGCNQPFPHSLMRCAHNITVSVCSEQSRSEAVAHRTWLPLPLPGPLLLCPDCWSLAGPEVEHSSGFPAVGSGPQTELRSPLPPCRATQMASSRSWSCSGCSAGT